MDVSLSPLHRTGSAFRLAREVGTRLAALGAREADRVLGWRPTPEAKALLTLDQRRISVGRI